MLLKIFFSFSSTVRVCDVQIFWINVQKNKKACVLQPVWSTGCLFLLVLVFLVVVVLFVCFFCSRRQQWCQLPHNVDLISTSFQQGDKLNNWRKLLCTNSKDFWQTHLKKTKCQTGQRGWNQYKHISGDVFPKGKCIKIICRMIKW